MHRQRERHERLAAVLALGAALFLPPLLLVFNRPVRVLGVPVLLLYLFLAWGLVIWLGARAARQLAWGNGRDGAGPGRIKAAASASSEPASAPVGDRKSADA